MLRFCLTLLVFLAASADADVVVTRDGRRLVGEVVRKDGAVIVRMKLGSILVEQKDILRIEPGEGYASEFDKRQAGLAPDDGKGRQALADWARERGLRKRALGLYRSLLPSRPAVNALVDMLLAGQLARASGKVPQKVVAELGPYRKTVEQWLGRRYTERSSALAKQFVRDGEPTTTACVARFKQVRGQILTLVAGLSGASSTRLRDRPLALYRLLCSLYEAKTQRPFAIAGYSAQLDELRQIEAVGLGLGAALPGEAPHEDGLDEMTGKIDREEIGKQLHIWQRPKAMEKRNDRFPGLSPEERKLIWLINRYRDMLGRSVVRLETRLCLASQGHTRAMLDRGFFAHQSPLRGLREPTDRVGAVRYPWRVVGEVLARKSQDPIAVFEAFLHSPTHHRTLIHPGFREIGIGKIKDYWTVELALRR